MSSQSDLETDQDQQRDPLDLLIEQYAHQCRQGSPPSLDQFAAAYPEHRDSLLELLPAVAFLEKGKLSSGDTTAPHLTKLSSASTVAPIFTHLGENRITREIGRGGMGIVYEAVQAPLGRAVAIKLLPSYSTADRNARARFARETQVVARLRHPNIVPIYTVGDHEGLAYYVMALIDGYGLDHLADHPELAPPLGTTERARWVAHLGQQAASALAYAHDQGILHRDIKPANLLLDSSGTLYLADFGLAKLAGDLSLTASGELSGTLRYLPPECLNDEADTRSDLYSLGLTLYELAAGRPAFDELNRARLLRQIQDCQAPPPSQLVKNLPRDLETIILKAIAREPANRYTSAADLGADLDRFLVGRPVLARRASALERSYRWVRRSPLIAALIALSLLLALTSAYLVRFYLLAPAPATSPQLPETPTPPAEPPFPPASNLPPRSGFLERNPTANGPTRPRNFNGPPRDPQGRPFFPTRKGQGGPPFDRGPGQGPRRQGPLPQ